MHAPLLTADLMRVKRVSFGDTLAVGYGKEHALGNDKSQPNAKFCQVWTDTWLECGGIWQIIASRPRSSRPFSVARFSRWRGRFVSPSQAGEEMSSKT